MHAYLLHSHFYMTCSRVILDRFGIFSLVHLMNVILCSDAPACLCTRVSGGCSSGVFVSQGVVGKSAPQVLPPGGKGHGSLSPGGGAGVGPQHEKGSTEHVPDLPHGFQTGISTGGEACRGLFSKIAKTPHFDFCGALRIKCENEASAKRA